MAPDQPVAQADAAAQAEVDANLESSLRIAIMRLSRRLRTERTDLSLGLSQLSALSTLARRGPMSPTALADYERIQPPSMTRVIAALEERGLIVRGPHPTDRRQAVIGISPEGEAIVDEDRRHRQAWFSSVIDALSDKEQEKLRAVLPILEKLIDQ